jgi:hypothetical protein
MPIEDLPICGFYDIQRFPQYCPADAANWYLVPNEEGKKKVAMYPAMGRKHINFLGRNQLQFVVEPRGIFKSSTYLYVVVQNKIYRIDKNFNQTEITGGMFPSVTGNVYFTFLVAVNITFACFTDGTSIYVYREDTQKFYVVTDGNAPPVPTFIVTFGNRLVVSQGNAATFYLSVINLGGGSFDPTKCFTIGSPGAAVFAQEDNIIGQMAVLHNTLYIFTQYTTGVWQNTPAVFSGSTANPPVTFPFKKNTTLAFDYGINDPLSLDVDFNMMAWEARNAGGLTQFMVSSGQAPERISTRAVDILLQTNAAAISSNPSLVTQVTGFLYTYENTIFYRVSLGNYNNFGQLDLDSDSFSLEFNFDVGKWSRCIEANGERNRAQQSVYFNNRHLITVQGEGTVYEMSGAFYVNELINPAEPNLQASDAYIQYPMRYERITPIIFAEDYSEFQTDYVEIDFVFGDQDFIKSISGFANTVYIIDENSTPSSPNYIIQEGTDADPIYIVSETGNYPALNEPFYNALFKPNITLYFSDDGGISFHSADNREFSQLGIYQWKMRWYQLGPSRNRVYKLVCVSPSPIVVLGGVQVKRRISGGAN